MPNGTLANLANSAFVRTPPAFAERIVHYLLEFPPATSVNILDPTAGEGDLLLPCQAIPQARLFGVEISAERTNTARERLAQARATIVTCAFEGVSIPKGSMGLILANPPYFFQDGKRAEYRILADAGALLMPGGVMVAIIPARSAWDGMMVNHWSRWYERVRVWKFPDRVTPDDEGAFEDFTQICVIGIRRAEPIDPEPIEVRRLQGYRYHAPSQTRAATARGIIRAGWEQGAPPPVLPETPITDPYLIPEATTRPQLVVRHANESLLLAALERDGAHLSAAWQSATEWREERLRESPVMPLSGEAHVAAEVLTGLLDGEIVSMPTGKQVETTPHLFTAFVGQEWVALTVDDEEREKLRERGVVQVSARQWQDKPILGVLNLATGETRYEHGEAVFTFLRPWLNTLAERVIEKRQPLYQLDPADWELRVVAQFGRDKQLPNAAFPGLSIAQQHRVYAMGRALDRKGRTAIQGEPGTGKTRLGVATAARMAYHWRHRNSSLFKQEPGSQPAWIRGLRRAWLKNPRTLALLKLTSVCEEQSGRIVAYRREDGAIISPEEAGPSALPVLVSTPKKVTKEYAQEIRVAWPEAEVVRIEQYGDIVRWFEQYAHSFAPAVIGIVSHSLTRAFGRAWQPVVREKRIVRRMPELEPEKALLPRLNPVMDARGRLTGYRWKESGELYTRESTVSHFFCPDCGAQVKAVPGKLHEVEKRPNRAGDEEQPLLKPSGQTEEELDEDRLEVVTSRTWFTLKPRWCRCRSDKRNQPGPRNTTGRSRVRTALWTDARLEASQRKHPQLPFSAWYQAVHALSQSNTTTQERRGVSLGVMGTSGKGRQGQGACQLPVWRDPLPDSFSPYEYLYRFFPGCVALTIVDESHNGRGRDTDIAHAHHQAMLAAQTRMLTSGTHYGGDVLSFFHYWFRFHPQFWRRLGLGWNDADKALERYGVIQEFTKEYESDARRGSGQTNVQVSTIPAPGLSAKLIPYLLEDLVYLTVLDVGAHMPPRIEIPEIVSMYDADIEDAIRDATFARKEAARRLEGLKRQYEDEDDVGAWQEDEACLQEALTDAVARENEVHEWAKPRHLSAHYRRLVCELDELAKERNSAARLAKGTIPRWFAALPCDQPFEVWQTTRNQWGDTLGRQKLASTEALAWEYQYPLERRLLALVKRERAEGRRIMVYFEQNDVRSMARRLEWVLKDLHPWTLPNTVPAEERQQAILQAVQRGHSVVIVPYRRVNEGLNLQSGIDSIIWIEMALNLFMLDQASRRAWRLGKREEVRIYYLTYANTAGHYKLRKLGQQSGAAAAFAGEPARGALIEHAGADRTTLARLSSLLEQHEDDAEAVPALLPEETDVIEEEKALKAVFAQRADELRAALVRGREWLGNVSDTLADRLAILCANPSAMLSVWSERAVFCTPVTTAQRKAVVIEVLNGTLHVHRDKEQAEEYAGGTGDIQQEATLPVVSEPVMESKELCGSPTVLPSSQKDIARKQLPTTPTLPRTIGSRALVTFGRSDHIALARVRSRARRTSRTPVVLRDIPALTDNELSKTPAEQRSKTSMVVAHSLWDWLSMDSGQTETDDMASSLVFSAVPAQSNLWEQSEERSLAGQRA